MISQHGILHHQRVNMIFSERILSECRDSISGNSARFKISGRSLGTKLAFKTNKFKDFK